MENKVDPKPEGTEIDDKGVPVENRIKEAERKTSERYEREMAGMKAEFERKLNDRQERENPDEMTKAELMRFVGNPKGYVAEVFNEYQTQNELREVRPWLTRQNGYKSDDDARLIAIETEYQLGHSSPLARAKAAWDILQKERRADGVQTLKDETQREQTVTKTTPDGGGKSAPKSSGPKRIDLIRELKEAESKGELEKSVRLMDMLEDVRE